MKSLRAISTHITWFMMEFEDLSQEEKHLLEIARNARQNAQAPYSSNFLVGAAVLTEKTKSVYGGCNVERVTLSQTTHAEQNAIDSMVRWEGPVKISKLAFVLGPGNVSISMPPHRSKEQIYKFNKITVPCGQCLQCIWENCHGDDRVQIFSVLPNGLISRITIGDAFPLRFGPANLGIDYSKTAI